ncbi:MAG: spore cortex biosynthesis protein YabQ [Clostridiales bacterium]|nr:spore cortex biosynthesis protein YabQ [Clostridiales bacterium]
MLRIWRRILRHRAVGMAVEDLLFWTFCAFRLFAFMYRQNDGVIRGFIILGAAGGMFLYAALLSRWVVKGGTAVLSGVLRFFGRILGVVTAPLRFAGAICKNRMRSVSCRGKRRVRQMKKRLARTGKLLRTALRKL